MSSSGASFDLSTVFHAVATAIPDNRVLIWRDLDLTYAQMDARIDGIAHYLTSLGLGCHTERDQLRGHQSGQDHMGLYLRNGNEYLEAMVAGYRARVAPFNVNYRYVEEELLYLLTDSKARALVYSAEFAPNVASIRDRLPELTVLIQVADDTGNALLPGAVDYESIVDTPAPAGGMPTRAATTCTSSTPAAPPGCPRACCGASTTSSCRRWAAALPGRGRGAEVVRRPRQSRPPSRPASARCCSFRR